tara:strand:+ start:223 stop:702 length:480 start_codon:yes stop_codon:yes gene_type:complete
LKSLTDHRGAAHDLQWDHAPDDDAAQNLVEIMHEVSLPRFRDGLSIRSLLMIVGQLGAIGGIMAFGIILSWPSMIIAPIAIISVMVVSHVFFPYGDLNSTDRAVEIALAVHTCPVCVYVLSEEVDQDGWVLCTECGAAWKMPVPQSAASQEADLPVEVD